MPQQGNNSSLIYNGQVIAQRPDGYVNATQMAKANNIELKEFNRSEFAKNYLKALQDTIGEESSLTAEKPVIVESIGFPAIKTTWFSPVYALAFAQWISPDFHVWCNRHIKTLIETGSTTISDPQPVQQLPPKRDIVDYVEAHKYLSAIADLTIQQLMRDKLEEELYQATGRLKPQLPPEKPKEYTIAKVRARELGYTDKEIGNGSILGRFVAKHIEPAYMQRVGKYEVKHYEIGDRLDTVIKTYFGLKRSLGK